jgi:heme-degrading monooxygenase HmoA
MISRVWHGWTTGLNADAYEALLKGEIVPGIEQRRIAGFHGMHVLRRAVEDGVEFVTIMWFDSMESVRGLAEADLLAGDAQQARRRLAKFLQHPSVIGRAARVALPYLAWAECALGDCAAAEVTLSMCW